MSKVIKLSVSDELFDDLCARAAADNKLSIQDFIRKELFRGHNVITPQDAVNIALKTLSIGDKFTVPSLFGEKWNLSNGTAGQFGRKFYALIVESYSEYIRFIGYDSRKRALYEKIM